MSKSKLFLGAWEQMNNHNFNSLELEGIKTNLGVPQGSGFMLQSFCDKTKRISTAIPHAKKTTLC